MTTRCTISSCWTASSAAIRIGGPCWRPLRIVRRARSHSPTRSEEHTSELQSRENLVCRLDAHSSPTRRSSDLMARTLAEEYGVAHRMSGVVADFAHMDDDSVHDLVVLDRVVCCYPDWRALLEAAADRASRAIALTYPREAWWTRFGVSAGNAVLWLGRRHFRLHVHPPAAMHALLRTRGFAPRVAGRVGIWEICLAPRLAEG